VSIGEPDVSLDDAQRLVHTGLQEK
jgi:hypothetical protein